MGEPIRVLHVFAALNAGGVENFVMNTYRRMNRSEIQYDFAMTSGQKGMYDEEVLSMGGRIFYFDTTVSITANLRRLFQKEHFDAVHSHVFFYSGLVLQESKRAGIPVRIAHAHNAHTGESRSLPRKCYEWLMRKMILKNSTVMFGCSSKACKYVFGENCFNDIRVSVLPDGIECDRFAFDASVREEIRQELGLSGKFVIGHVGHFTLAKNHEKILDIFAEFCKNRSDARLLLVGDGELEQVVRDYTEKLGLKEKVIFAGAHSDVEKYYQAMDVFLFPSKYEGFGMAIMEAQANGLYCVASDVVPTETDINGMISFVKLDVPSQIWAETLMQIKPRETENQPNEIVKTHYDVQMIVTRLSKIYMGENQKGY